MKPPPLFLLFPLSPFPSFSFPHFLFFFFSPTTPQARGELEQGASSLGVQAARLAICHNQRLERAQRHRASNQGLHGAVIVLA